MPVLDPVAIEAALRDVVHQARARRTDPKTSKEAAETVRNLRRSQIRIYTILLAYGPMTDEQIYAKMKERGWEISPSGCRTRRNELVEVGLVEAGGRYGLTKSGRRAIVWQAVMPQDWYERQRMKKQPRLF